MTKLASKGTKNLRRSFSSSCIYLPDRGGAAARAYQELGDCRQSRLECVEISHEPKFPITNSRRVICREFDGQVELFCLIPKTQHPLPFLHSHR